MLDATPSSASLSGDFPAEAQVASEGTGASVSVGFSGSTGSHHDGDVYDLQIDSATGTQLFNVTRAVTYTTVEDGCGGASCSQLSLDLYP